MTAEQLEAARAERMRQNGPGAITIEDVRTWIEETGLCIFLPRSAQAGQATSPAPTFIEAVAGQPTTEPTLELIASAESLLVRLEAEGVAVRLNLSGLPGDQPDYVVAGWVLPYIYALRGDRDWRRSPQLTGSRQVSPLAVQAAKQIDSANMTATEIRDALGREVTEAAVLRALHELWKQLRIIPVVPAVGSPALWQPLRQRFQKAIAEGASTSQVTAISVLASIYLQAVIAASMEDVEMFLSPLTSRSKIREVVRGLAATRQVHSTTMGHSSMYYVAGTLPEFPALPSFQISSSPAYRNSNYRGSAYLASYLGHEPEDDYVEPVILKSSEPARIAASEELEPITAQPLHAAPPQIRRKPAPQAASSSAAGKARSGKSAPPRPRPTRTSASGPGDRRRAPAPRSASSSSNGSRSASVPRGNGNYASSSSNSSNGNGANGHSSNGHSANGHSNGAKNGSSARPAANGSNGKHSPARPVPKAGTNGAAASTSRPRASSKPDGRGPVAASAAKRYSFSGQAKQAPKPASAPRPAADSKRRG